MAVKKTKTAAKRTILSRTKGPAKPAVNRKRSLAAKKGAVRRAKNRELTARSQLRLHHKLFAGGAILAVLVLAFLGIRTQLQTYAATTASGTFTGLVGKCLDNRHSIVANHNPIQLYHCNGTNAQKWTITSAGTIVSGNNSNYCLDIPGASLAQYTYLQLYHCNGTNAQRFLVKDNKIISTLTGYCATVKYAQTADSTRIWMKRCNGGAAQKWIYSNKSSTPTPTPTPAPTPPPSDPGSGSGGTTGSPAPTGTLLFDDEFNGSANTAPDASKWEIMGGSKPSRWGVECYVNDRSHIKLDGQGHLVETGTYNPSGVPCSNGSGPYESGGMTTGSATGGLFSFKYGTIEARIQVPCQSGTGVWPAWWADGPSWPKGGEIDFLEVMNVDHQGYSAVQTLHGPTSSGGAWQLPNSTTASTRWCGDFHTYGAIWTSSQIQFTIDGNVTKTYTPSSVPSGGSWPFDSYTERLLLNLEIGSWGGTPNSSTFPQSMVVDYVRVYK